MIGSMLPEGVYHWTAKHPQWEGPVSSYAIDDGERLMFVNADKQHGIGNFLAAKVGCDGL